MGLHTAARGKTNISPNRIKHTPVSMPRIDGNLSTPSSESGTIGTKEGADWLVKPNFWTRTTN